jgi:DNA-binding transcriptional MerR regulator
MNKYSAEDIVDIVNAKVSMGNISYGDSRVSRELTVRRLRDYIYKGLVSPPHKEGKYSVFTDEHLNEIYNVRMMNLSGYSDSVIKKETEISKTQSSEKTNNSEESIHDMIDSMKKESLAGKEPSAMHTRGVSSYLRSALQPETKVNNIEHYLSEDGKTYIKLDRNKVKQLTDEEVDDAIKNCVVKIDLTNE